jgi:hypothetical protein
VRRPASPVADDLHTFRGVAHAEVLSQLPGGLRWLDALCDGALGVRRRPGASTPTALLDRSLPPAAVGPVAVAETGAVVAAVAFTWLGMVLAISFLEAPLKFRAPGVTTVIGLGIGRLVFRALNVAEGVLALVVVVAAVMVGLSVGPAVALVVLVVLLLVQLGLVRPRLNRRSDRVLAGEPPPRSRLHLAYIGLELVKVVALVVLGVLLLGAA